MKSPFFAVQSTCLFGLGVSAFLENRLRFAIHSRFAPADFSWQAIGSMVADHKPTLFQKKYGDSANNS